MLTRESDIRRALRLEYFTISWNTVEAVVGIAAGLAAGSIALVSFALDSVIESSSGIVLVWRLHAERTGRHTSVDVEHRAVRGVAVAFLALAAFVTAQAGYDLTTGARPEASHVGIALALVSLVVMPALAWRKILAARQLDSRSMRADSTQTVLCAWLSAILLAGLAMNARWGWWWADPVAALGIAAFAAREGRKLWRTEDLCC